MVTDVLGALSSVAADRKGPLLEEVLRLLLLDFGFVGVRKQHSGTQFGFDLAAHRVGRDDGRSEVWKFECKNLESTVKLMDIAPKLIWQFGSTTIDYFVVVSVTDLANDVMHLLETVQLPMPVVLWTGDVLERLVRASPLACRLLSLPAPTSKFDLRLLTSVVHYPVQPVCLDVVHSMDPPREFAYALLQDQVVKHYTDNELYLAAHLSNDGPDVCDVHRLTCRTERYEKNSGRTLRLVKPKGFFDPPEFRFRPSTSIGSETDVLDGRVWRVAGGCRELAMLALSGDTTEGRYQVSFRAQGARSNARVSLVSASFPLQVGRGEDELNLMVVGRHYDTGAEAVLRSPPNVWAQLAELSRDPSALLFLGPTHAEVIMSRPEPTTWIVQRVQGRRVDGELEFDGDTVGKVVADLKVPIREELYSLSAARARVHGADGWQGLLSIQLDRRRRR